MAPTTLRLRQLVEQAVLPFLATSGFERDGVVLAALATNGVRWLIDLEVAPWTTPERLTFAVGWGVHVPGLEDALGDPAPDAVGLEDCLVAGRLGDRPGRVDPRWFDVRDRLRPLAVVADATVARAVVGGLAAEAIPALERLASPTAVQRHLHERLVTRRGLASDDELLTIRRIAALSAIVGDRANARRWLDHLERRSVAAMAPDVAAARLAPLRQRLAS